MSVIISNAFSLNMISIGGITNLEVSPTSLSNIREAIEAAGGFTSVVGHADTAVVFSNILGLEVPYNRVTFSLGKDDILFVGQHKGARLPEGATSLPEGASIEWARVNISKGG